MQGFIELQLNSNRSIWVNPEAIQVIAEGTYDDSQPAQSYIITNTGDAYPLNQTAQQVINQIRNFYQ